MVWQSLLNSQWHELLKVWEVSAKTAGAYYVDFFSNLAFNFHMSSSALSFKSYYDWLVADPLR